jgi:hypothetical protein
VPAVSWNKPLEPKFYATLGRAFLGRQFTSRYPRSLATPIHRAVAQPGHGFVACFIIGVVTLFASAGCFSLSLAYTGFIAYLSLDDLDVSLLSSGQVVFWSV